MYKISETNLIKTIEKINSLYPLVIPIISHNKTVLHYTPKNSWGKDLWHFATIRTPQPLKTFFYPPVQKVGEYPSKIEDKKIFQPLVIIGPKSCDIHALQIIDKVYAEGEYPDPYYKKARKEHIIISSDCLGVEEHCYCTLMNCQPYPKSDFDINISKLNNQYLLEIGNDRGQQILKEYFEGIEKAPKSLINERDKKREIVTNQVRKQNEKFHFYQKHQDAIEKHLDSKEWADLSKTCVECGICTQICPTCHCFLMYDQTADQRFERIKIWDSCFFAGYSRMAGGLTPRLALADRFKNRFYHKFDSFVTNFGIEACTGCGRCVEGCMGNIDLREVLLELEKRVVLKENLDLV